MALIKLLNEFYVYIFEDRVHVKMSIRFQITIFSNYFNAIFKGSLYTVL